MTRGEWLWSPGRSGTIVGGSVGGRRRPGDARAREKGERNPLASPCLPLATPAVMQSSWKLADRGTCGGSAPHATQSRAGKRPEQTDQGPTHMSYSRLRHRAELYFFT